MFPDTGMHSYLIDKELNFIPYQSLLQHRDTMKCKKLKPTEARCLLLLLEKQGVVVSQNDLMEFAWGEKHREVSFNVFYQCVLSLRKSFIELDFHEKIITTVPRKGLMIEDKIAVEFRKEIDEKDLDTSHSIAVIPPPSAPPNSVSVRKLKFRLSLPDGVIFLSTVVAAAFITFNQQRGHGYFQDYLPAGTLSNQCQYFFNADTDDHSRHDLFIRQNPEICKNKKFLYITAYNITKNISAIVCSAPIDHSVKNQCQAFYYPEYQPK